MVNTLEEFESLPESLVAEFVDGRIKVFDSLTSAQHEIRNELLVKASQYLKEAGLDACMALLFHANVQIGNDIFEPALFACEKEILRLQHLKLHHGSVQLNCKNIWMQLYRNIGLLIWKHDWFLCTDPLPVRQV